MLSSGHTANEHRQRAKKVSKQRITYKLDKNKLGGNHTTAARIQSKVIYTIKITLY